MCRLNDLEIIPWQIQKRIAITFPALLATHCLTVLRFFTCITIFMFRDSGFRCNSYKLTLELTNTVSSFLNCEQLWHPFCPELFHIQMWVQIMIYSFSRNIAYLHILSSITRLWVLEMFSILRASRNSSVTCDLSLKTLKLLRNHSNQMSSFTIMIIKLRCSLLGWYTFHEVIFSFLRYSWKWEWARPCDATK